MKKVAWMPLLVLLAAALPSSAQQTPTRVYTSYYEASWGDMLEWMDLYQEHWQPRLQAAVDAGMISGFGAATHNTGGNYNFRLVMQGNQDTNFDRAGEEILFGWMEEDPESFNRMLDLMKGHADEIWNLDAVNLSPNAGGWRFMYENLAEIAYADFFTYPGIFQDAVGPMMDQAMEDGVLAGWIMQSHNTGAGPYNWKVMFLFEEWGDIEEFQARFLTAVPMDHPVWDYFLSHRDELWEAMPPSGN